MSADTYQLWELQLPPEIFISRIRVDRGEFLSYTDAVAMAKSLANGTSKWEIEIVCDPN